MVEAAQIAKGDIFIHKDGGPAVEVDWIDSRSGVTYSQSGVFTWMPVSMPLDEFAAWMSRDFMPKASSP